MAFTYYGISLNISGFSLDPYVTHFIFGAIEIPAKVSVYVVLDRIGRRHCQAWTLIGTGGMIALNAAIPAGERLIWLVLQHHLPPGAPSEDVEEPSLISLHKDYAEVVLFFCTFIPV